MIKLFRASIIGLLVPVALNAQSIRPNPILIQPQPEIVVPATNYTAALPVDVPFDFSDLEKQACDYYSGNYKDNSSIQVDCDYKVWRNKKFEELRIHDDIFSISAKLYYYLIFHQPLDCQCGWNDKGSALDLTIGSDTKLTFDDNMNLTAKSTFRPIQHGEHCRVCFFNRDLTDIADRMINEKANVYLKLFDDMLSSKNAAISSRNAKFISFVNEDIAIDSKTHFKLNAQQLKASKISSYMTDENVQHLTSVFTIKCNPEITSDGSSNKSQPENPPNDINPDNHNANEFAVNYSHSIPYNEITSAIMDKAKVYVNGRRKAIIQSCEIIPNSGILGLKFKVLLRPNQKDNRFFSKVVYFFDRIFYKKWGYIYLNSSPSYDAATNSLRLADVQYTDDTKNVLLRKAKWLAGQAFCDNIQASYQYSNSQRVSQLVDGVTSKLTTINPFFKSTFTNQSCKLLGTRNAGTQFEMLYKISGDLQIH